MNEAGYALIILCALAGLADVKTRIYYGSFGLMMLGHYFATWPLGWQDFDIAYLSSAALCAFLVLMLPKTKDYLFLSLVCGACVVTNIIGYALWDNSLSIALYDGLYLGIYCAVVMYLIPKALNGRINKTFDAARRFFRACSYHSSRYLGAGK